jgi:hypothetical protein
MVDDRQVWAGIALAAVLVAVVVGVVLISQYRISATGKVKTLGLKLYSGPDLKTEVSAIAWGKLAPGDAPHVDLWAVTSGNVPSTLSMNLTNWTPLQASNFVSLGWNYTGNVLQPKLAIVVRLTLTLSRSVSGFEDFSFDIIVSAKETIS